MIRNLKNRFFEFYEKRPVIAIIIIILIII